LKQAAPRRNQRDRIHAEWIGATNGSVSGRPGRLPARAPHRSGRAEFPHPALQAHGFAARR
jgi:hypothetical protein